MPYNDKSELPDNVQNVLPAGAQDIYLAAYNNAYEEYKDPDERRGEAGHEETAHRVAWSAVKQKYHKSDDGKWASNDD